MKDAEDPELDEEQEEIDFENNEQDIEIKRQRITANLIYPGYLTLNEMIAIILRRADTIAMGAPIYIDTAETDTHKIALLELVAGKCPLAIEKSRGIRGVEEIIEIHNANDLIFTKKCISAISDIINLKSNLISVKEEIKKLIDEPN
jgi:DNA-directed RNA polymerase subunit K/omega